VAQCTSKDATWEKQLLRDQLLHRFILCGGPTWRQTLQPSEAVVLHHKNTPVVGPQIVYRSFEQEGPELFADVLDDFHRVSKTWSVPCVPLNQLAANASPHAV